MCRNRACNSYIERLLAQAIEEKVMPSMAWFAKEANSAELVVRKRRSDAMQDSSFVFCCELCFLVLMVLSRL